jgi:hypothetical protein
MSMRLPLGNVCQQYCGLRVRLQSFNKKKPRKIAICFVLPDSDPNPNAERMREKTCFHLDHASFGLKCVSE